MADNEGRSLRLPPAKPKRSGNSYVTKTFRVKELEHDPEKHVKSRELIKINSHKAVKEGGKADPVQLCKATVQRMSDEMMRCAKKDNVQGIEHALHGGADLEYEDSYGFTAFLYACVKDNYRSAMYLAKCGADINHRSKAGSTALMYAASSGRMRMLRYLLSLDPGKINVKSNEGNTPLMLATINKQVEMTSCFFKCKYCL